MNPLPNQIAASLSDPRPETTNTTAATTTPTAQITSTIPDGNAVLPNPSTTNPPPHNPTTTNTNTNSNTNTTIRRRYHTTPDQAKRLMQVFLLQPSPPENLLHELSQELSMPLRSLVLWFKNRRARCGRSSTKDGPAVTGQWRRSYVKSGIYRKRSGGGYGKSGDYGGSMGFLGDGSVGIGVGNVMELVGTGADSSSCGGGGGSTGAGGSDCGVMGRGVVGLRKVGYGEEVLGEDNACCGWDCVKCEEVCVEFLKQKCGGGMENEKMTSVSAVQMKMAKQVAQKFFSGEFQSGCTLTSYAQDMGTILFVLDSVMNKIVDNDTGEILKSGMRALLREFMFMIRSGKAAKIVENVVTGTKSEAHGGPDQLAASSTAQIVSHAQPVSIISVSNVLEPR